MKILFRKHLTALYFKQALLLVLVLWLFVISGCANESKPEASSPSDETKQQYEVKQKIYDTVMPAQDARENYKVILTVDEEIMHHENAELLVWIGYKDYRPIGRAGTVTDSTTIPSNIGSYARITPYAPDFQIQPSEQKCIKLHPSGSVERFNLIPKESGTFVVSANIEIFDEPNCSGNPIPKTASTLTVVVKVDSKYIILEKAEAILNILWECFIKFWGELLAGIFTILLGWIIYKLKKKTGQNTKNEKS